MSYLFEVNNNSVSPSTEALIIPPFKDIWERDKSKKKEKAISEFSYIEFMASMKKSNPYKGYPEDKKHTKIVSDVIKIKNWKPDKLVLEGIKKIQQFQTEASATYSYFMSVKTATENMKEFLNNVDLTAANFKTGNPIYKPKELTSALIDTEKVLSNLNSLQSKVEEELFEQTKNRANKEISYFANPDTI